MNANNFNSDDVDPSFQRDYWESVVERRSPDHPAVKAFAKSKIDLIADAVQLPKLSRLLEVGCGNGFFSYYLKNIWDVTALDRSRNMLQRNPVPKKVQGTLEFLPVRDAGYEIVMATNVLHHIPDPLSGVGELARASKRFVVLIEPNRNNPLMLMFGVLKHEERGLLKFSREYLEALVDQNGLKLLLSCGHGTIVPNKTPTFALPFLEMFNGSFGLGFYNLVVAQKS